MATITSTPLDPHSAQPWDEFARAALGWANAAGIAVRDMVVIVPFAQHLVLARRAWAATGGWLPRIETTQTLARALGPPPEPVDSELRFDAALDRLTGRRLLRSQSWIAALARSDPRAFDHAVAAVVSTAQAIARAAAAVAPARREAHWARARTLLSAAAGPGGTERALSRVALEWAAASAAPPTDALFALTPSAWVVLKAGGADALVTSLLEAAADGLPCLILDADVDTLDPFGTVGSTTAVDLATCLDFEDEAQRAAAQVLAYLNRGLRPVALIAQDRLLTRRVHALLARQHVPLQDETGWKLSTTRAAAAVAAMLRATRRDATTDDWLDWLKGCDAADAGGLGHAVRVLEGSMRRHGWNHPAAVDAARLDPAAARAWQHAWGIVERLRATRSRRLGGWLRAVLAALEDCGMLRDLRADDAGRQVLAALQLDASADPVDLGGDDLMSLEELDAWVDCALEEGSFLPAADANPAVVVTPLERALLRPFGAVVMAGADEKRLGAPPAPQPLLGDALATELGIPGSAARRERELLAFAQVLRAAAVSLLRRRDDGGEPLAPSPLLERLELARAAHGRPALEHAEDRGVASTVVVAPVARPSPEAGALLPARLSASACEALRSCPYRFFSLRLLGLREPDELDDEVEKRDYGIWLHEVLRRFHGARAQSVLPDGDAARLRAIGLEVQREMRLDDAAFLPFAATFASFVPRYAEWLRGRDAGGASWLEGEVELSAAPVEWGGIEMHGVVDRIDSVDGGAEGPVTQLIDYKTGSPDPLRARVKEPLEDTQLAFYAALVAARSEAAGPLGAAYLPLDERDRIRPIEHADVAASARQLVAGVGAELARIRAGAGLPALGEGAACTFCEARGLCRRDQWAVEDTGA